MLSSRTLWDVSHTLFLNGAGSQGWALEPPRLSVKPCELGQMEHALLSPVRELDPGNFMMIRDAGFIKQLQSFNCHGAKQLMVAYTGSERAVDLLKTTLGRRNKATAPCANREPSQWLRHLATEGPRDETITGSPIWSATVRGGEVVGYRRCAGKLVSNSSAVHDPPGDGCSCRCVDHHALTTGLVLRQRQEPPRCLPGGHQQPPIASASTRRTRGSSESWSRERSGGRARNGWLAPKIVVQLACN